MITGYINCIPQEATGTLSLQFQLPYPPTDKSELEAGDHVLDDDGAASCTVAGLSSHRIRDAFCRACHCTTPHHRVGGTFEHVGVEVAACYVEYDDRKKKKRFPRKPGYVVHVGVRSQGDDMGKCCKKIRVLICTRDIGDDLRDSVLQEKPGSSSLRGAVLDAAKVEVRLPGAAGSDAERVVDAQVATTPWTIGERGSGRNHPVRFLASL